MNVEISDVSVSLSLSSLRCLMMDRVRAGGWGGRPCTGVDVTQLAYSVAPVRQSVCLRVLYRCEFMTVGRRTWISDGRRAARSASSDLPLRRVTLRRASCAHTLVGRQTIKNKERQPWEDYRDSVMGQAGLPGRACMFAVRWCWIYCVAVLLHLLHVSCLLDTWTAAPPPSLLHRLCWRCSRGRKINLLSWHGAFNLNGGLQGRPSAVRRTEAKILSDRCVDVISRHVLWLTTRTVCCQPVRKDDTIFLV